MPNGTAKIAEKNFGFRVKMGDYEVDINGTREEVLRTIEDLQNLITNINKAFENVKPKKITTLTVKTEAPKQEKTLSEKYPKITPTEGFDEAILKVLETDWGKWRPRTIDELREALKANGMDYPGRMLAGVLIGLVKKGKIRRWNTDAGFVYILAEKEIMSMGGEGK